MLKRLTIRQRILFTFVAITLVGGFLQLIIAGRQLQHATLEFYQRDLETDALMIAATLAEPMEHFGDGEGADSMQRQLGNLQQDTGHDYILLDNDYRIIGASADTSYETFDSATVTPELVHAREGRIGADVRKDAVGAKRLYVAVGVQYERFTVGYLVLSRPMQPAYAEVYRQWLKLGSITVPVIGLVVIAGLWLSGTISRPVQQLRNSALMMAEGALDTRIDIDAQDEIGQLAHAFNYMAEQIESMMKTQRSFINNAAHELRTPLMTLKLRIEALQDETLPGAERAAYLTELREEIDHMAELVSSLLALARIDEGGRNFDGNVSDVTSVLHDIARHWRIKTREAGLDFVTDIPAELPDLPLTSNDLRLALDNLLGNAIKYTEQGKVDFAVRQDDDNVIIQVRDTGLGFSPEQAEQLFTRFYRSEEARVHNEGNGLGLSIARGALNQCGATITAESAGNGQGATFTVYIPLAEKVTSL
jgi:signal transduction histidine kinase